MKNFLEAKFQLFCQKTLQTFFSKNRLKNFFKVLFGKNAKKKLARASAVAGKNINSGLEIYEMS